MSTVDEHLVGPNRVEGILRQRLADATTSDNKHNFWPDKLEVINVELVDQFDPMAMHHLGYLLGSSGTMRQIRYSEFDWRKAGLDNDGGLADVRRALPLPTYGHYSATSLVTFHFRLVGAHGQEDDFQRRNIYAIHDVNTQWSAQFKQDRALSHGLIVTIGCKHDYKTWQAGNCYRKGECRRCGHTWAVDSSG